KKKTIFLTINCYYLVFIFKKNDHFILEGTKRCKVLFFSSKYFTSKYNELLRWTYLVFVLACSKTSLFSIYLLDPKSKRNIWKYVRLFFVKTKRKKGTLQRARGKSKNTIINVLMATQKKKEKNPHNSTITADPQSSAERETQQVQLHLTLQTPYSGTALADRINYDLLNSTIFVPHMSIANLPLLVNASLQNVPRIVYGNQTVSSPILTTTTHKNASKPNADNIVSVFNISHCLLEMRSRCQQFFAE
ncbi:hypothetical protein RFI_30982, partial [Reticulomyxa filosa]